MGLLSKKNSKNTRSKEGSAKLDPLYVIFEQHLLNFADAQSTRKEFIANVIHEYFKYLNKSKVTVPPEMIELMEEELGFQVNTMLVKKIYGCLTIADYQKTTTDRQKKSARVRYSKLKERSR